MNVNLAGKSALVTGGGVGIGRAVVHALADSGARVVLTSHHHDGTEVTRELAATGQDALAFKLDVTDRSAARRVIETAAEDLGGTIDILVNNAGGLVGRVAVEEMSDEHWDRVVDLNLTSVFTCVHAVLPFMAEGGRIVNISSLAAHNGGGTGAAAYSAAKAGVDGLTRSLAKELGPRQITVNAVAPGLILDTPFHETFTPTADQQLAVGATPLRRAGEPTDVAGAVLFLASELGSFCTGTVLDLNGGTHFR